MSILASQTLGNVTYIKISEPYPMFSATTNYVAITSSGRLFVNIPNSSQWFPIDKSRYSEMQDWNKSGTIAFTSGNNGVYSFFGSSLFSPTATTLNGFTVASTPGATALTLSANTDNTGRYLNMGMIGTYVPNTSTYDQMPYEILPTLNSSTLIPVINSTTTKLWGAGTDCVADIANAEATQYANRVFDIDGNVGDFIKLAARVYSDGITTYGTMGVRHYKISTKLLEEPTVLLFENFENGISGIWNYANENQINKWIIGSGTSFDSVYSAYITSGSTVSSANLYDATATSISHIWTDIKFPIGNQVVGKTPYYLSFRWKSSGTTTLDFGSVYLTPTYITPTGGTAISSTYRIGLTYTGSSNFSTAKIIFSGLQNTSSSINYLNETWETGSITGDTGGWTVVNDTINKWIVSSATSSGGTYSAYISNGISANTYTDTDSQASHLYRDITIPSSAYTATLTFNWKAQGENGSSSDINYDYGAVVIADTGTTPVAGTEVFTTGATSGSNGRIGATTNRGKFNLNYIAGDQWNTETINMTSYIGLNKKLIFTWSNDSSLGDQPPMAIDNIILSYTIPSINDSDGYVTQRLIFSWQNDNTGSNNPPMAIDNVKLYCYPSVPNDKI